MRAEWSGRFSGGTGKGDSQPPVRMALQCVQTRVFDATQPAQDGHVCCRTGIGDTDGYEEQQHGQGTQHRPGYDTYSR